MKPVVFLLEEHIRNLLSSPPGAYIKGESYCMDNFSVIHSFTETPKVLPAGQNIETWFISSTALPELPQTETGTKRENGLVIFFALENDRLISRALLVRDK